MRGMRACGSGEAPGTVDEHVAAGWHSAQAACDVRRQRRGIAGQLGPRPRFRQCDIVTQQDRLRKAVGESSEMLYCGLADLPQTALLQHSNAGQKAWADDHSKSVDRPELCLPGIDAADLPNMLRTSAVLAEMPCASASVLHIDRSTKPAASGRCAGGGVPNSGCGLGVAGAAVAALSEQAAPTCEAFARED